MWKRSISMASVSVSPLSVEWLRVVIGKDEQAHTTRRRRHRNEETKHTRYAIDRAESIRSEKAARQAGKAQRKQKPTLIFISIYWCLLLPLFRRKVGDEMHFSMFSIPVIAGLAHKLSSLCFPPSILQPNGVFQSLCAFSVLVKFVTECLCYRF